MTSWRWLGVLRGCGAWQGPSHILQVARWFAAASEEQETTPSNLWAEPRGDAAAAAAPMPVYGFNNKFACGRGEVSDGYVFRPPLRVCLVL